MSLRAILSGSRVKKRTAPAPASRKTATSSRSASSTPPWPNSLRQTKPGSSRGTAKNAKSKQQDSEDERVEEEAGDEEDFLDGDDDDYKLDDSGLLTSLADDLSLRDVVQALRYARSNMFDPLPQQRASVSDDAEGPPPSGAARGGGGGFVGNSTRVAELLNMRRRMPPLATTAHIAALLPNATATERETVALVRAGMLRKVVQPQWRRGFGVSGNGNGGRGGGGGGSESSANSGSGSGSKNGGDGDGRFRRALAIGGESLGEVLVETAEFQQLVRLGPSSSALSDDTKSAFVSWLEGRDDSGAAAASTTSQEASTKVFTVNGQPAPQLTVQMVDELVRAGFLVGHGATASHLGSINVTGHRSASAGGGSGHRGGSGERGSQSDTGDVFARPEDRTTLLSLETVAKAASGSFDAVGGVGAVYTAGGGGARAGAGKSGRRAGGPVIAAEDLMLAIPGHGTFIKLVSGALACLIGILAHTPYRETLETSLRERWDAGGSIVKGGSRVGRQGFKRVPLSRTKKWKDFYGLSFDWVLAEAVGAGLVELFDTGSVGRGVRLLS